MKFKLEYITEINDIMILEVVNIFQEGLLLEEFVSLKECPSELIIMALEEAEVFDGELDYLDSTDFIISKID